MNVNRFRANSMRLGVALALAGAVIAGKVAAQEAEDPTGLTVTVGGTAASGDEKSRARFGLYNGLRDHSYNANLGFSYGRRENDLWLTIRGRDLALDNRELDFSLRKLGDFKLNATYSEITRHDPRTINTGLINPGSTTPTVVRLATPGTGADLNLQLQRKGLAIEGDKWILGNLQFEASFKNEDKTGARFWGKGFPCSQGWQNAGVAAGSAMCATTASSAVLMLPEPVDSVIRQAEAKLNYWGERLNLTAAYYGSFYRNNNGNLAPQFNAATQVWGNQNGGVLGLDAAFNAIVRQQMALWPDNQAHQFSLAGNYRLAQKTRINFKYSWTRATQNESFTGMGLFGAPGGRSDLDGRVDSTKAQVGFSTHPLHDVHVHGDLMYDGKKTKTPTDLYNTWWTCTAAGLPLVSRVCAPGGAGGAANTRIASYTNPQPKPSKIEGKLEGNWHFLPSYTATFGVHHEREDYGPFTSTDVAGGVTALKQKMHETGWRAELRRVMSEQFTGAISYQHANRQGKSSWQVPVNFNTGLGATGVTAATDGQVFSNTAIFPFMYQDRVRDKYRVMGTWTPMERASVQLFVDGGRDRYIAPNNGSGLNSVNTRNISVDATYDLSQAWKLSAYGSRGRQWSALGHTTDYDAIVDDATYSLGFGVRGTPHVQWKVGADFTYLYDRLQYRQEFDPAGAANAQFLRVSGGLPPVVYRLNQLRFYSEYAVQKNASIRLDLIRHITFFNEWTYNYNGVPFLYSDNTTLNALERQAVTAVGVSLIYKFQ